jgi:acetyl-CoA carboxylase biotin carboxyl carrier protein
MKRSDLTEFAVEEEGFKLKIRRGANGNPVATSNGGPIVATLDPVGNPLLVGTNPSLPTGTDKEEPGVAYIKAPMVGTFYRSPSPESPAFVEVNAKVEENSVICIIEAMKIMNEIQAEAKGTVLEVLVENGQPVEYGQRLFKIKQA